MGEIDMRQALKRLGFMKEMKQLPGLLKQERETLSCSFKVLFRIQGDARVQNTQFATTALQRLMHLCDSMLRNYAEKERLLQDQPDGASEQAASGGALSEAVAVEIEREVMGLVPIISEV